MTTQPKFTEKLQTAHRDHVAWQLDYGRWRSEHRQALAMLAKVQAAILEQEAALESHAAQVQSHQLHLHKYELSDVEAGGPESERLEAEQSEFARQHERARDAHQRIKKHHVNIVGEVEKLLKACTSGM